MVDVFVSILCFGLVVRRMLRWKSVDGDGVGCRSSDLSVECCGQ